MQRRCSAFGFLFLLIASCKPSINEAKVETIDFKKVELRQEEATDETRFCEDASIKACSLIAARIPMAYMQEKPILTCSKNGILFSNIVCEEEEIVIMRGIETVIINYDWIPK